MHLEQVSTMHLISFFLIVPVVLIILQIQDAVFANQSLGPTLNCGTDLFACRNAYRCLEKTSLCDGNDECRDGSDEELQACIQAGAVEANLKCDEDKFKCKNGFKCIPTTYLCDDDNDCKDWSDEDPTNCIRHGLPAVDAVCSDVGFECGNGNCIAKGQLCNGVNDCGDSSDEILANCIAHHAVEELYCDSVDEFRCKNGFKCIPTRYLCDGDNDCLDNSDESATECGIAGVFDANVTCADLGFECRNSSFGGSFCIGNLYLCDGRDNCGDKSDESPSICHQRSQRPKIELLPWYEPPQENSEAPRICPNDKFKCKSTPECFPRRYTCDGLYNCRDKSDEDPAVCLNRFTSPRECEPEVEWRCGDGRRCITAHHQCDGFVECFDGSDEDPSTCPNSATTMRTTTPWRVCMSHEFRCQNSHCIPNELRCDGYNHCGDNSDETTYAQCATQASHVETSTAAVVATRSTCPPRRFQCTSNLACIDTNWVCDGHSDCPDDSDESPANCHESSTTSPKVTTYSPEREAPETARSSGATLSFNFLLLIASTVPPFVLNTCQKILV